MACDNLQEPLESFPALLNDLVGEAAAGERKKLVSFRDSSSFPPSHRYSAGLAGRCVAMGALDRLKRELDAPPAEDLAWQWRNVDPLRLALEDVAERLKIRVSSPDGRVADAEGGDIGLRAERSNGKQNWGNKPAQIVGKRDSLGR